MRPIEFRVWDKIENIFIPWDEGSITLDGTLHIFGKKLHDYEMADKKVYIIQQFTGLLDKNGVKIFEGDIIGDSAVVYNYDAFGLVNLLAYHKHKNHDESNFYLHQRLSNICFDELIVIGNIYQNPDLLKEN